MKKVFSFTLFGNEAKYCKGLLKNIDLIQMHFPEWETWVYCGDGISEEMYVTLFEKPKVKLIPTNQTGMINKFYRFFAIDDPDVEICIVRDADSRIYERDQACIREFLESDKVLHIIRDHPNHHHVVMAGMWGMRKCGEDILQIPISVLCSRWLRTQPPSTFWSDTVFLCQEIYPRLVNYALIHDETQRFESEDKKTPFPYPIVGEHFIGQVYEFDKDGMETTKFTYKTEG